MDNNNLKINLNDILTKLSARSTSSLTIDSISGDSNGDFISEGTSVSTKMPLKELIGQFWVRSFVAADLPQVFDNIKDNFFYIKRLRKVINRVRSSGTYFTTKIELLTKLIINLHMCSLNELYRQIRHMKNIRNHLNILLSLILLNPSSQGRDPSTFSRNRRESVQPKNTQNLSYRIDKQGKQTQLKLLSLRTKILETVDEIIQDKYLLLKTINSSFKNIVNQKLIVSMVNCFDRTMMYLLSQCNTVIKQLMSAVCPQEIENTDKILEGEVKFMMAANDLCNIFSTRTLEPYLFNLERVKSENRGQLAQIESLVACFDLKAKYFFTYWKSSHPILQKEIDFCRHEDNNMIDQAYIKFMNKVLVEDQQSQSRVVSRTLNSVDITLESSDGIQGREMGRGTEVGLSKPTLKQENSTPVSLQLEKVLSDYNYLQNPKKFQKKDKTISLVRQFIEKYLILVDAQSKIVLFSFPGTLKSSKYGSDFCRCIFQVDVSYFYQDFSSHSPSFLSFYFRSSRICM